MNGITFSGIFSKATTTIDGGWVISFQVDQSEAQQIIQVSQMRQSVLQVAVVPIGEAIDALDAMPGLD